MWKLSAAKLKRKKSRRSNAVCGLKKSGNNHRNLKRTGKSIENSGQINRKDTFLWILLLVFCWTIRDWFTATQPAYVTKRLEHSVEPLEAFVLKFDLSLLGLVYVTILCSNGWVRIDAQSTRTNKNNRVIRFSVKSAAKVFWVKKNVLGRREHAFCICEL